MMNENGVTEAKAQSSLSGGQAADSKSILLDTELKQRI